MSLETEVKRIADALEKIIAPNTAGSLPGKVTTPGPGLPEAPDLLPATTKKGKSKAQPATTLVATVAPPKPEMSEVSKADITSTLQTFLKKFPGPEGAEKARVFFTNVGAKNITTLDPSKYKEVFLGLQQAMK